MPLHKKEQRRTANNQLLNQLNRGVHPLSRTSQIRRTPLQRSKGKTAVRLVARKSVSQAFSAGVVASSVAYIATRTNTNAPLTTKPRVRPKYEKTTRLLSETKSRRFNRLFFLFPSNNGAKGYCSCGSSSERLPYLVVCNEFMVWVPLTNDFVWLPKQAIFYFFSRSVRWSFRRLLLSAYS